jgi:hypothetical protein
MDIIYKKPARVAAAIAAMRAVTAGWVDKGQP